MILITGGLGFIGSHTVVELLEKGESVVVFDNLYNSKIGVLDRIEQITGIRPIFYEGDIRSKSDLEDVFKKFEIHEVIHFAGLKAVGESVAKPVEYYKNNVGGTLELLDVMKSNNVKKIVFSSSATVYGGNPNVPFDETYPLSTTNPYGTTKMMIEEILRDVYLSDDSWSICLLRYFNPIGAHPSGLIGEDPNDIPNNLIPYIAKVASGEISHLNVYGDDYDTIDGTGVRDYVHVVDLAKGHLSALEYARTHKGIEAFNLGTGVGRSVLEVLRAYEKACGKELNYEITSRRSGDIATCYASVEKANKILKWEAEYSLEKMCKDSWRFKLNSIKY